MLTGQQAFGGETITDIVAAVMKEKPDWSRLPAGTPSTLRSLLRQCLNKQPRHRLHDIADARVAIEDALTEPAFGTAVPNAGAAPKAASRGLMFSGFAVFLIMGALTGWLATRRASVFINFSCGTERPEMAAVGVFHRSNISPWPGWPGPFPSRIHSIRLCHSGAYADVG